MRFIYSIALYLLAPFVVIRLFWQGFRIPEYRFKWRERFGHVDRVEEELIWIHAVSVGEAQAAVPLVTRLQAAYPRIKILITTVTPTGAGIVKQRLGDSVKHLFLPYDLPHAIHRFMSRVKPLILLVMETELWPNLYHQCKEKSIPILLVNGRLSSKSCRGYKKLGRLTREVLGMVDHLLVQTAVDANRYLSLGAMANRISVVGNMKYDIPVPQDIDIKAAALRHTLSGDRPVWIAASTHEGEEIQILSAHREIVRRYANCLLILAPRHPQRFARVAELCRNSGFRVVRKTDLTPCAPEDQIFILDSLGELLVYYAMSDIAFVGGSLMPLGGHNTLEPASVGVPVLSGPHINNFREINKLMTEEGAQWLVENSAELTAKVLQILADEDLRYRMGDSGRKVVERNRGSTEKIMNTIRNYLPG